ncbi:hypothetical protein D3C73_1190180 [compost metagenome]
MRLIACFLAAAMTCASRALSWIGVRLSHLLSATRSATLRRSFMVASSGCRLAGGGAVTSACAPQAIKADRAQIISFGSRGVELMVKPHWAWDRVASVVYHK